MRKSASVIAKSLVFVLILIISSQTQSVNSATFPKAGLSCSKKGMTQNYNGKKFTCVKNGNKLAWNSGEPLNKSTVILPSLPTSFSDLFSKRDGIAYSAWLKINNANKSNTNKLPSIRVIKGANSRIDLKNPQAVLQFVSNIFTSSEMPNKVVIVYFTEKDVDEVKLEIESLIGSDQLAAIEREIGGPFISCDNSDFCNVGHAHISEDGTAIIAIGTSSNGVGDVDSVLGGKEISEFYHSLQLIPYHQNKSQISTTDNRMSPNFPPAWLNIPAENLIFASYKFKDDFRGFANSQNFSDWMNHQGHPVTIDWLENFLEIRNLSYSWSNNGYISVRDNNCFGSSIVEIFVALKGPSILLKFHEQMSKGIGFEKVFLAEFGITWEKASPIIAKVIYDKYINKY